MKILNACRSMLLSLRLMCTQLVSDGVLSDAGNLWTTLKPLERSWTTRCSHSNANPHQGNRNPLRTHKIHLHVRQYLLQA